MDEFLPPDARLARDWQQAIAEDLGAARELILDGKAPLAGRVKQVRSRLKRSQALLRLAPAAFAAEADAASDRVRAVRRKLGAARDAQARLEALGDVLRDIVDREGPGAASRFAGTRARLAAAARKAGAMLRDEDVAATAALLIEARGMLARTPCDRAAGTEIIDHFRQEYRRARRRRPRRSERFDAGRLHRFRAAAVAQLYQSDLVAPDDARQERLGRIRRLLGKVQDLQMLRDALVADSGLAAPAESRRLDKLARLGQRRRAAMARRLARALFRQPTRRFWPKDAGLPN